MPAISIHGTQSYSSAFEILSFITLAYLSMFHSSGTFPKDDCTKYIMINVNAYTSGHNLVSQGRRDLADAKYAALARWWS